MARAATTRFQERRSKLSRLDDYPGHQTLENVSSVEIPHPMWTDRFIIEMHDPDGDLMLFTGAGVYANADYFDGFAVIGDRRLQRNVRAGRNLSEPGRDRSDLGAGPLQFTIESPMEHWRLEAADAGQGFAFDLAFRGRTVPYEMPTMLVERDGQPLVGYSHFVQAGLFDGWIEVDGTRREISGWPGERDRSWGFRPASARVRSGLHLWVPLHFEDISIWFWSHENADGVADGTFGAIRPLGDGGAGEPVPIASVEHDLDVELVGPHRVLRHACFVVTGIDGSRYEVEAEPDGPLIGLSGAGYGGPDPQGTPKGPDFVNTDGWGTGHADLLSLPHTILKSSCRLRCGERRGRGGVEISMGEYRPLGFGPVEEAAREASARVL
jgi:hypothetical protein